MDLKSRFIKSEKVRFKSLIPFQGELKRLSETDYNKLRRSIIAKGVISPFFVWESPEGIFILDGHQRSRVIGEMIQRNEVKEDLKVVCVFLQAEGIKEAKELLLFIASQYGEVTQESVTDFIVDFKLNESIRNEIKFNNVDFKLEFEESEKSNVNLDTEKKFDLVVKCKHEKDRENKFKKLKDLGYDVKVL